MNANYKSKLLASAVTAVLLMSGLVLLTGAQAGPADDLEINDVVETLGSPPPRVNIPYDLEITWENEGSTDYEATVRLYDDCDMSSVEAESDSIDMVGGESGVVSLQYTFTEVGEVCYSAAIYYGSTNYGEFEVYMNVEPETGDADLWVQLDMEGSNFAAGEPADVIFEYGNEGDVSTLNPLTIKAYFDPIENQPTNYFYPSPFNFDYLSPPDPTIAAPPDFMDWEFKIPEGTCDLGPEYNSSNSCDDGGGTWTLTEGRMHKFTVYIDSEENNTDEDNDLQNNIDIWEICIGNCDQPDLQVAEEGTGEDSIMSEPLEAVAGGIISFVYGISNTGQGDADCPPAGPNCPGATGEFVTHLEVQKCAGDGEDPCAGSPWEYKNIS